MCDYIFSVKTLFFKKGLIKSEAVRMCLIHRRECLFKRMHHLKRAFPLLLHIGENASYDDAKQHVYITSKQEVFLLQNYWFAHMQMYANIIKSTDCIRLIKTYFTMTS